MFPHEQKVSSIDQAGELSRTRFFWIVNYLCDYTGFDFLWEPTPWQARQRHAWPSQWQPDSGTYLVPKQGYTNTNYRTDHQVVAVGSRDGWHIPNTIDVDQFDFSWHPNHSEPPYIYQFGTQHQKTGGPRYAVPGATEVKYVLTPRSHRVAQFENWIVPDTVDADQFDYSWHPDDTEQPYIYQFGTQWQKTGGPRYVVPGATEVKYVASQRSVKVTSESECWTVPDNLNTDAFDFTWHPDNTEKPYKYQFPTQWSRAGGPEYTVPGATEVKYVTAQVAKMLPSDHNWQIPIGVAVNSFDFSWTPDPTEPPYIYQFGTQWQKTGGPRYVVPGATEVKYITQIKITKTAVDTERWQTPQDIDASLFDFTWHPDSNELPYIYQFGTQWQKTGGPRYVVPGATEVKYVHAQAAIRTAVDSERWTVPNNVDTDSFDFTWHPDSNELPYIYQFGTQHQKTGGPKYTMPGATEVKYITQIKIKAASQQVPIYEIDHIDGNAGKIANAVKRVRYVNNYRDTLIRLAKNVRDQHEFVWVCSSVCDYSDFDFSWHPEQWQLTMLHVFASNEQKFGDTFFMHVPTFADYAEDRELLEWYDVNFITEKSVPRRPMPLVLHQSDTHVDQVKQHQWSAPLTVFATGAVPNNLPAVNLWREKTKTIVPLSTAADAVIVPQTAVPYIKTQLYDYPHIDKSFKKSNNLQMDVIFISYDEPDAEQNWQILINQVPRARRVHGVKGMELALEAAADVSTTPWYYAVFAKTKIHENFDFSFVPDYMQQPKHYIFDCLNTVNGLQYGHMGIVMYNCWGIKQLNLNKNFGLDYTLSFAHESVPVLSCYGNFDQTPYHTWRTAFRESAKLAYFESVASTVEGEHRLHVWQNTATGKHAEWCLQGARDGVEFFSSVAGELDQLKQSFDWTWLRNRFVTKYGERE